MTNDDIMMNDESIISQTKTKTTLLGMPLAESGESDIDCDSGQA
jgi:hypothetical protein